MLRDELEAAYALIDALPFAGEPVPHSRIPELRRVLLARTQYHLYYVASEEDQIVEILALWHTSRRNQPAL